MGIDADHDHADHADGVPADDEAWQALEQLVLDMRRRAGTRNGRLHAALETSLRGLAVDAAALAADGGLESPVAPTPWTDTPEGRGPAAEVLLLPTPAQGSTPAETPPEDLTPAVEEPEAPVLEAETPREDVTPAAAAPLAWVPAAEAPREDATPSLAAPAAWVPAAETPRDDLTPAVAAPAAWVPAERSPQPADTWVSATERAPAAEAEPAPAPSAEPAVPAPAWRVGTSRTNPVPPAWIGTRAPWVPTYVETPPPPGPAPSPIVPTPPPRTLTAWLEGTEPGEAGPRDEPRPQALSTDPIWSPEEWQDPHPTALSSTPPWLVGAVAAIVLLITAVVTYLLVRG